MVELALTLSVLLLLMFGIMDFGRALYAYHFVSYASHEATRWASVRGSTCKLLSGGCPAAGSDVQTFVQSLLPPGLYYNSGATLGTSGYLGVTTTWAPTTPPGCTTSNGTNSPGCPVNIVVTYTFGFNLPYLSSRAPINMTSTSQLIISQ